MSQITMPGPTLGVVGGGQLGRMLAEAASPLGVDIIVLDPTPDCPASTVARDQIVATFDDADALEELASRCDQLTFEIELADPELLSSVSTPVEPAPETLMMIQDKLVQNRELADAGVPMPAFEQVDSPADLAAAIETLGSPVMLKARSGGYDGRGNLVVEAEDDFEHALTEIGGPALAERFVSFERELAVIGVVGAEERTFFPVTETIHREEILRETVVPARVTDSVDERARDVAQTVLSELDGRGVFGIELFETTDGTVLFNEVAPRPHNSGHWTIEGASSSQFEQHVRAVLGWPLAGTTLRAVTVTTNLLADVETPRPARLRGVEQILRDDRAHLHWYDKHEARPLRKMGHVTVTGHDSDTDRDHMLEGARELRESVTFQPANP